MTTQQHAPEHHAPAPHAPGGRHPQHADDVPLVPQVARACTPGPIWRDSNVRTGPSLDSPIVELLLPEEWVSYEADGWSEGDTVVEGEHPCGEITSSLWFRLAGGGWTSAVNFEPSAVHAIVPGGSVQAAPLTSGSPT